MFGQPEYSKIWWNRILPNTEYQNIPSAGYSIARILNNWVLLLNICGNPLLFLKILPNIARAERTVWRQKSRVQQLADYPPGIRGQRYVSCQEKVQLWVLDVRRQIAILLFCVLFQFQHFNTQRTDEGGETAARQASVIWLQRWNTHESAPLVWSSLETSATTWKINVRQNLFMTVV